MSQIFKRMYWSTVIVTSLLLIIGIGWFLFQSPNSEKFSDTKIIDSWSVVNKVKEFSANIFDPNPLRFEGDAEQGFLTTQGVLSETNRYRQAEGLKVLSFNAKLEQSAKAKLEDMFEQKYFAHISKTGEGPGELASTAHYEFIVVGENLALGNFADDSELVKAWMDSPGHRANIMNKNYRDIGIAVGRGVFEGKLTWLAVQEFGIPISLCNSVNESQEVLIISNKKQLAVWDAEIKKKHEALLKIPRTSPEYQSKALEYNTLVDTYNELSRRTKAIVSEYNEDVTLYNDCLKGFNL